MTSAREEKAGFDASLKNTASELIWRQLDERNVTEARQYLIKMCIFTGIRLDSKNVSVPSVFN